jgi:hypothetical protein
MKCLNKKLTTSYVQLPNERVADVDFTADKDNSGVVSISLHDNPEVVVDKLGPGDSFNRQTSMSLDELDAKSTVADDVLIIRW